MLEKLTTRWEETGVFEMIDSHKCIVMEPRTGGKEMFDSAMSTYYQEVAEAEQTIGDQSKAGPGRRTGALFLAVCRGKVSEGLDFSDNNARAVITIGIPYPALKNKQIELKREYNNMNCKKRHLLTGNEWYDIQAYRALNQALGRCLRHKKDWGALILVDARYGKGPHYTKGLSKWVKQRVQHESNFRQAMTSLKNFTELMMRGDVDSSMNDSKASVSVLEKSPSSSSISIASSMASPPASSSTHPLSLSLTNPLSLPPTVSTATSSHFLLNSPGAEIPDKFDVTPPRPCQYVSNFSTPSTSPLKPFIPPISSPSRSLPPNGPGLYKGGAHPTSSQSRSVPPNGPGLYKGGAHPTSSPSRSPGVYTSPSHATPVPAQRLTANGERKYPTLLPMQEILKLEEEIADAPSLSDMDVHENHSAPNKLVGVAQQEDMLVDSSGPAVHEDNLWTDESTILYSSEHLQDNGKTPNSRSSSSRHRADSSSSGIVTGSEDTPTIVAVPTVIERSKSKSATPSLIPDTPPDSPLMFDDIESSELDLLMEGIETAETANSLQPKPSETVKSHLISERATANCHLTSSETANSHLTSETCREDDEEIDGSIAVSSGPAAPGTCVNGDAVTVASDLPPKVSRGDHSGMEDHTNVESPLMSRTRRSNLRLSTRKMCHTASSANAQSHGEALRCSCGEILMDNTSARTEKIELKNAFNKKFARCKVKDIQTSKLWHHMQRGDRKGKTLEALLVSAADLRYIQRKGTDADYDCVWDEKIGVCYSLLHCCASCEDLIGVLVHATRDTTSNQLVGKAIISSLR